MFIKNSTMMLFFVAVIAICGILYELLIGTLSSYLIGNSVQQFSFVIGFFLSGMGIGAYLSRFLEKNALKNFFVIEMVLSVFGATSVLFLKFSYIYLFHYPMFFQMIYFLVTIIIGSLVGMEIPLVAEIYKKLKIKSQSLVSDIFTFDYIGGLFASLLFPLVLLPLLGLYNIAIFIGTINLFVGIAYLLYIKKQGKTELNHKKYIGAIFAVALYFIGLFIFSVKFENVYMQYYYKEPILETYRSESQEVVLTKRGDDFRMYLNGHLQFVSLDENRYHEALVDYPMNILENKKDISVLVLGAGDGLAVRNLLAYKNIKDITLVELDPKIIDLAQTQNELVRLNEDSLSNEKVTIITTDAFNFITKTNEKYDLIIADFPDPRETYTVKLYTKEFYIGVHGTLHSEGVFVTQASNAFFSNKVLFSIEKTVNSVFGRATAYHRYLPSFGDWGFVIAKKNGSIDTNKLCGNTACNYFDKDYYKGTDNIEENTIANPKIIEYYVEGYKKFNM